MYSESDGDEFICGMMSSCGLFKEDVGDNADGFVTPDVVAMPIPIRMLSACNRSYFSRRDLSEKADGCAVDMVVGAV